ncbi:MAG: peptidylprolyl isomerase [Candidatus Nitrosomirales archaeon]|jgi:peptidylprolyl isomerase
MALDKGSLVLVNYTAKIKDTDEAFDTTIEEDAKKFNIHDPTRTYEPRLISVGDGWVLKGLDEALTNANVGENMNVEVPPDKGFGARDPEKVRMIPLRKLGEKAEEVKVGDAIEIDDKVGIIRFIGSGRVQIDYNHRLAGKTITYALQVLKRLEQDNERITALIKRRIPIDESKLKITLNEGNLDIELPSENYMQEGLQVIKRAIVNDVFKYVTSVKKIKFIETYEPQAQSSG